jgi:hypothetical protein
MRRLIWVAVCAGLSFSACAAENAADSYDDATRYDAIHFSPDWRAACELSGKKFGFSFQSPSGDASEDDMRVSMTTLAGKTVALPLKPALYVRRGALSSARDLCQLNNTPPPDGLTAASVATFDAGQGRVLMWLSRDNRPQFDTLVLALVDAGSGRLLDSLDTGLQIKDSTGFQQLTIRPLRGLAWQIRLVTEVLPYSDSAESYIEGWVGVSLDHNRIRLDKKH